MWCGRVLGAISARLDKKKIEELYLQKALTLCQDTDYDVRCSMCSQLKLIAFALGAKSAKEHVLPELIELNLDEEPVVRESAAKSVLELLEIFDSETRTNTIIPMWKKFCEDPVGKIPVLVASTIGQFMYKTKSKILDVFLYIDELTDADKKFFMNYYKSICLSHDEALVAPAAYNFPVYILH